MSGVEIIVWSHSEVGVNLDPHLWISTFTFLDILSKRLRLTVQKCTCNCPKQLRLTTVALFPLGAQRFTQVSNIYSLVYPSLSSFMHLHLFV